MIYEGQKVIFNHTEQYQLLRQIQNQDENQTKKHEEGDRPFSIRLAKYLLITGAGDILDGVNALFSLIFVMLHAVDTYSWPTTNEDFQEPNPYIVIIEIVLIVYFILAYLINFYISENRIFYAFNYIQILEYVSIVPTLLLRMGLLAQKKLEPILSRRASDVTRNMFKILFTLFSIMVEASSFLMVVEKQGNLFHDYLYFTVVTMSTVGFGDIYPHEELGRVIAIITILILLMYIPTQIEALSKSLKQTSKYATNKFTKKSSDLNHILILGNTQLEGYKTFLSELYHQDHGVTEIPTVIMKPHHPNEEMQKILQKNHLQTKLTYLYGNPLNSEDLKRAQTENSQCVIILADKMTKDADEEDKRNIMYTLAVKQYVQSMCQNDIRVCVQLLKPELKDIYFESLNQGEIDQVICVDELKLYLLSKTCLCPGINTIISFLITSDKPGTNVIDRKDEDSWINDYIRGMQNEIYRVPLEPDVFAGYTFCQISQAIFKELEIILFALEVSVLGETKVFVNPADYLFQDYVHHGYVIASSCPNIKELQKVSFENIPKNHNYPNIPKNMPGPSNLKSLLQTEQDSKYKAFYQNKQGQHTLQLNQNTDKKFENHYIVCGIVSGMKHLLMPLRARSLKTIHPIIILNNDYMPSELWNQINHFPKVYCLQGSPLKQEDLERACVGKALALVILSKPREHVSNNSGMVDADTIFIYKTVKYMNPKIQIITELASMATISFLSQSKNNYIKQIGHIASEPFASGEIYISTMLDTLICQAYYNPFIINILDQMIMGGATLNAKAKRLYSLLRLQTGNLFLINIPISKQGKTFGELYDELIMEYKMIPIGLYKGAYVNKNIKPYVYLNPPSDHILNSKDQVYVLSIKQPKEKMADQKEDDNKQLNNQFPNINLKSKLQGEEGRTDIDIARQLFKLSQEISNLIQDVNQINEKQFHRNLSKPELIPQLRSLFKYEMSNLNIQQNLY
ncbi:hypothetical protein IMG5_195710 [Ichthyophthirius multifiliis]|uniref:RCK N-terminal domain-containing protein n=1 Tax=Ichthyophthirius multifiliis TaxID=5932 RepID=G0R4Z6_ICHMU|nr:hypothetical protein IMG5_195710 [Ichthyophthirius multifiliis]EGR27459.1 hypothetical protein IMG5_195710 [Ichthyophthirius multifiliis]|eukprot:XP_004024369.1 hypothetical protein IMG5_195710 [Ichthyophthirius multifiliis]